MVRLITTPFILADTKHFVLSDNGRSFMISCFIDRSVVRRNSNKPSYAALLQEEGSTIP